MQKDVSLIEGPARHAIVRQVNPSLQVPVSSTLYLSTIRGVLEVANLARTPNAPLAHTFPSFVIVFKQKSWLQRARIMDVCVFRK